MANYHVQHPDDADDEEEKGDGWWIRILSGLFFFALSGVAYWWINKQEQEGGRFKIWWVLALVYHWLGKVGVSAVIAALGVLCVIVGLFELALKSRQNAET